MAHIPALRALSGTYEIVGVANTSRASADAAAQACSLPRAFDILSVIGTQARVAPEIEHLRQLITDGFVGEVLSTTISARGGGWGATIDSKAISAYLLDRANGATMLTIPVGHTLAALRDVLGDITELSAVMANRRHEVRALDTGELLPMSAPDQVLVSGVLTNGAPVSIHYRGGTSRGTPGFVWEINGSEGDIRVTGPSGSGNPQMVQLSIEVAAATSRRFAAW
jgi:predicted dehydrogenase